MSAVGYTQHLIKFALQDALAHKLFEPTTWVLTPTALFRTNAKSVFLPPRAWPKWIWQECACDKGI